MMTAAFDDWATAQRQLADAEIEVIRWELHESGPVPQELKDRVHELQLQTAFLFEVASAHLASPHNSGFADL